MGKGKLITLEGIDGSGKTSVAKRIVHELKIKGVNTVYTFEPTNTWLGDSVKKCYDRTVSPFTELFLFLGDRATHTDLIRKWIENDFVVLCDRYSDSTYAYQAVALKEYQAMMDVELVDWLKQVSRPFVIVPDLTILLDVDPATALSRIKRKGTKFEKKGFLEGVRAVYRKLANDEPRFVIVDASRSQKSVVDDTLKVVLSRLQLATGQEGLGE